MTRGWLLRRLLLVADVVGISCAFLAASVLAGGLDGQGQLGAWAEFALFLASLPAWVIAAKLLGLYERDEFLTDHSTLDDFMRVLLLVTLGAFVFGLITGYFETSVTKVLLFWAFGIVFLTFARSLARLGARRSLAYVQNAVIVGAGTVGQLVARKLLHHPEYGINPVGFVHASDAEESGLEDVPVVGTPEALPVIVRELGVERVIVAFSREEPAQTLRWIRALGDSTIQIDIVPRLFEVVGSSAELHELEGLPIVGLPPARIQRSSMFLKRTVDVVGATALLVMTAPLFAYAAWRIKRESPGPIFFRQTRLGMNQARFTFLKFRTMRVDTDDEPHREYIKATMEGRAAPSKSGLFKLDRSDAVTSFGRWLRSSSLDELPQLINVLRGDMSLVGPRPCLPYEVEHFSEHHFERFLVPAGLTGLWQVRARGHSTFADALDMDVLYVRSWSFSRDVALLLRTPLHLLRPKSTA